MAYIKKPILFVLLLGMLSCGRHVDPDHEIRAGYRFRQDTVLYHKVVTWWKTDSIRHAFSDYAHADTIDGTEYVLLVDTGRVVLPIIPPPSANRDPGIMSEKVLHYGVGNMQGMILVFPRFHHVERLYGPYLSVRLYQNGTYAGLLHASGYMVSDVAYTHFVLDSATLEIQGMINDSLAAVFPVQ